MVLQARSKDVASLQKNSVPDFVRRSRERWISGLWLSFAEPQMPLRWYWTEQRQTPACWFLRGVGHSLCDGPTGKPALPLMPPP